MLSHGSKHLSVQGGQAKKVIQNLYISKKDIDLHLGIRLTKKNFAKLELSGFPLQLNVEIAETRLSEQSDRY